MSYGGRSLAWGCVRVCAAIVGLLLGYGCTTVVLGLGWTATFVAVLLVLRMVGRYYFWVVVTFRHFVIL